MEEVTILGLEPKIKTELVKENVTDKVIAEIKTNYGHLRLKSIDDKETYLEIKDALKVVSKVRTTAVKVCKKNREEAIREQKLWIAAEKSVVDRVREVEDVLDAEIEKFDAEVARKDAEEKERKEAAYINRQAELTKMGATYSNGSFLLGDVSFEANLIKESDEDTYAETILPKYKLVYEALEAKRIEEEKVADEKAAELKRQQDELEQKQREFEEKQAAFKKQQEEIAQKAKELQLQKEKQESEARQNLINQRSAILSNIGMQFDGSNYFHSELSVSTNDIAVKSEQDWISYIQYITPLIEQKKKEAEEKRLADIKAQQELAELKAAQAEREKVEEEQRQEAIKKQQEEERKALELAQSDDKTKWAAFIEQINNLVHQEMKSPTYRKKQAVAKEKLEEICQL